MIMWHDQETMWAIYIYPETTKGNVCIYVTYVTAKHYHMLCVKRTAPPNYAATISHSYWQSSWYNIPNHLILATFWSVNKVFSQITVCVIVYLKRWWMP